MSPSLSHRWHHEGYSCEAKADQTCSSKLDSLNYLVLPHLRRFTPGFAAGLHTGRTEHLPGVPLGMPLTESLVRGVALLMLVRSLIPQECVYRLVRALHHGLVAQDRVMSGPVSQHNRWMYGSGPFLPLYLSCRACLSFLGQGNFIFPRSNIADLGRLSERQILGARVPRLDDRGLYSRYIFYFLLADTSPLGPITPLRQVTLKYESARCRKSTWIPFAS